MEQLQTVIDWSTNPEVWGMVYTTYTIVSQAVVASFAIWNGSKWTYKGIRWTFRRLMAARKRSQDRKMQALADAVFAKMSGPLVVKYPEESVDLEIAEAVKELQNVNTGKVLVGTKESKVERFNGILNKTK